MDGGKWKGGAFICPCRVEDDHFDDDESKWGDQPQRNGSERVEEGVPARVVCLLDMARPEKVKGIRKEFEFVERWPNVIVLEDDEGAWAYGDFDFPEDDWEEILIEEPEGGGVPLVKSFADVLRGG